MDSSNSGLNYMLEGYISEYLIGFPKSTTFDHSTLIRTYVDICQHRFFRLIALALYILAQRHSLTKENLLLAYYFSDIKIPNCFYNELFALYLNRNTC